MKEIQFDNGIQEYVINGKGILRFNPADPNLYLRFSRLEQAMSTIGEGLSQDPMTAMEQADRKLKDMLGEAFGCGNDFHRLLEGVNLLAMTPGGNRVFDNLVNALSPVLQAGVQSYADALTQQALAEAETRRGV